MGGGYLFRPPKMIRHGERNLNSKLTDVALSSGPVVVALTLSQLDRVITVGGAVWQALVKGGVPAVTTDTSPTDVAQACASRGLAHTVPGTLGVDAVSWILNTKTFLCLMSKKQM